MAKDGDKIYFGDVRNRYKDEFTVGVVANTRVEAIKKIKNNINKKEMQLINISVTKEEEVTLFEDLDKAEQEVFRNNDFFIYD